MKVAENFHQSLTGHTRHTRHTAHQATNLQVTAASSDLAGALGAELVSPPPSLPGSLPGLLVVDRIGPKGLLVHTFAGIGVI